MWGAQKNELSDTAPGPWVPLLTITQDSPSFIAHTRRLLRVCNNYLGLAMRSLVPAQRGWCSVSLHSNLDGSSDDSWYKITPLILRRKRGTRHANLSETTLAWGEYYGAWPWWSRWFGWKAKTWASAISLIPPIHHLFTDGADKNGKNLRLASNTDAYISAHKT